MTDFGRIVELVTEYGQEKFGDEWWPGNAAEWIGEDKAAELAHLLEQAGTRPLLLVAFSDDEADCLVRTAAELWDNCGDPYDVLSDRQCELAQAALDILNGDPHD